MTNLYKANMKRIAGNNIFIGGCIIAFLVTYVFASNLIGLTGGFERMGIENRMFFVSIAMMAFFTIFVPLHTGMEYKYGAFKNKLVAGYSQKEVYISQLLGYYTSLAIMAAVHFLAGILGGARDIAKLSVPYVVYIVSLCGYIAVMLFISFRITKIAIVSIIAFFFLSINYNVIMFGNFLISFVLKGVANKIAVIIYNMSTFGQWFVELCELWIAPNYEANPGVPVQILISAVTTLALVLLTTAGINKREIK